MQNPSSYYAVPKCEGRRWSGWQQSEPSGSSSRASSSAMTLKDTLYTSPFDDPSHCSAIPISYTLTPPTPDATDSDASSASQLSMESIPELDDMPEIPFVSAAVARSDSWIASDRPAEPARCESSTSFWSSLMRRTSSKSSDASTSTSASSAVLGQTNPRSLSPARTRKRAGSVSSIASSRTKPAPAKSILSSADSTRTRRQKAPSVKFLDMPTIHYDDADDDYLFGDADERDADPAMSPPPKKKAKGLGGLLSLRWLFGSSAPALKAEHRTRRSASAPSSAPSTSAPGRPAISGPYPLWDAPPRRARGAGAGTGTSAASLRSVKSNASLRSVRSCGSRLPTYWPR